nr:hypothetical protein [Desulfobacterales bacterium]
MIRRRKKTTPAEPDALESEKVSAKEEGQALVEPVETPEISEIKIPSEPLIEQPLTETMPEPAEPTVVETAQSESIAAVITEVSLPTEAPPELQTPDLKKAEPEEKPAEAKKPPKKAKKGFPAKIISLPEVPEEAPEPVALKTQKPAIPETPEDKEKKTDKKKVFEAHPKKLLGVEPEEDADSAAAKKNRKKKLLEPEKGRKIGKIKVALRRKEVIEGDALYDQTFGRGRKSQKKQKAQLIPVEHK